jgi:DNA-binding NtrC family response regulator
MSLSDSDFTLTSPLPGAGGAAEPLLALTIIWHPDPARIGAQFVGGMRLSDVALSRYAPLFASPGDAGLPLGHGGISRQPLRFARGADDSVAMALPESAMVVEVNGRAVTGPVAFDAAAVAQGQVLTLGGAVVLCLHWMDRLPAANPVPGLVGVGSAAIGVREQIRMVAPTELPVLLLGPTGTGKEIAARAIHAPSRRAGAPLVAVNMAALNEALAGADLFGAARGAYTGAQSQRDGLFAEADGATLFLDEIGNAPPSVQPMLLRVLEGGAYRPLGASQDRRSTARLIAATDQDLDASGFNQALLRRLEGFVIQLPPLRTRREDIGVLILHLMEEAGLRSLLPALPVALVAGMAACDWPGNVRQLANALKRAVLLVQGGAAPSIAQLVRRAGTIEPAPLETAPAPLARNATLAPAALRRKPAALSPPDVLAAMELHAWTIQAAALALGVSRPSLYKLLDSHPDIRRADSIPAAELERAMAASDGDVARGAALLKTPAEALRRRWRQLRPA